MPTSTKKCGNEVVRVNYSSGLEKQAEWLLSLLEKTQLDGVLLAPGVKIQVGWSFIQFKKENDELVVCEPKFDGNPFTEIHPDVTTTLQIQAYQNNFIKPLGVPPTSVTFQDKIFFSKNCLKTDRVYAERIRSNPNSDDSTWFFGYVDGDNDGSNLESGYVFQLLALRPALMPILLLPPGYMVVFNGNTIEEILTENDESVFKQ